ncbi:MAG: hypothetical protein QGG53_19815 [Planctomycetota bacterium]|jgi:hypothetical protein|nr:hypothetical protein [Planctomycetota bacterium]
MSIWRLVTQEILHRKLNFVLGLISVVVAVGALLWAIVSLRSFDRETEAILQATEKKNREAIEALEKSTNAEMAKLENEIRKITKGMGFNIYIFPQEQDLGEIYSEGYASKTMPEDYVTTLASSKIITVNHLLPSLTQKVKWPEQERTVLLIGIRGEVPIMFKDPKKPLIDPVPDGTMVVGYELHRSINLKEGDTVKFMDREYKIHKAHEERGSVDDITIWMPLKEVQSILKMEKRINAILALECNCATIDRLGEVRQEIARILPKTQVIEKGSKALARAEARNLAKATAAKQMKDTREAGHAQIEAQKSQRESLRGERESFAAILVPLVVVVCAVWIGFLTFTNAKERTSEIGILRAIGISSTNILVVFLLKAFVVGFAGALLASVGVMIAGATSEELKGAELGAVIALAPVISCAAAWLPALMASQQDPALVLREE